MLKGTMHRILIVLPLAVIAFASCVVSSSGEAPSPVVSILYTPSSAGIAAMSGDPVDPRSCSGVLAESPETHVLDLEPLSGSGQGGGGLETMCSAVYTSRKMDDTFLAIALMSFDSNEHAADHYELLKNVYVTEEHPFSELNSVDDAQVDRLTARSDRDGIGQTTIFRQKDWVLTISNGPTIAESPWTGDDLHLIGESIIARAQQKNEN
jgi:hypothetical protein